MNVKDFIKLIEQAKNGDDNAMLEIIEAFEPLLDSKMIYK